MRELKCKTCQLPSTIEHVRLFRAEAACRPTPHGRGVPTASHRPLMISIIDNRLSALNLLTPHLP